ncbi:MAG TPA: hypothetical protein DF613_04745 [Lachnospiraceae bacterium]|nr:hypothetical protein [Lachnospiraceae bacterium]
MYTLGLMLVTCLMPCVGIGIGIFFMGKGSRRAKEPVSGAVSGDVLTRIGRLAAVAGAVGAAVTVAVLLLTLQLARHWRVGVAVAVVTVQYVVTIAVVIAVSRMLRRK